MICTVYFIGYDDDVLLNIKLKLLQRQCRLLGFRTQHKANIMKLEEYDVLEVMWLMNPSKKETYFSDFNRFSFLHAITTLHHGCKKNNYCFIVK
jgi:hypothetical protein